MALITAVIPSDDRSLIRRAKEFDSDAWQSMRREARKIRNKATIAPILATDFSG